MFSEKYLVSIIMPAYNTSEFISIAIDSVIKQTHTNWELIIINDGSTDNTAEIINQYMHSNEKITLITIPNSGVCFARNLGFSKKSVESKFSFFFDSDDYISPEFLEEILVVFESNKNIPAVYSNFEYIDANNQLILNGYKNVNRRLTFFWFKEDSSNRLSSQNILFGSSISEAFTVFKNDLLEENPWNVKLKYAEGLLLFLKLINEHGKIFFLDKKIYFYRVRENQSQQIIPSIEKGKYIKEAINLFFSGLVNSARRKEFSNLRLCVEYRLKTKSTITSFLHNFKIEKFKTIINLLKVPFYYMKSFYYLMMLNFWKCRK